MGSGHQHGSARTANARALKIALALTGTFLVAEVIGGSLTGSLALISDAAHMLTDTVGLVIALAAIRIGERPADSRRTFGYQRFEILAAAFNAIIGCWMRASRPASTPCPDHMSLRRHAQTLSRLPAVGGRRKARP